jgi:tricorn protease-like protein
MQSIIQNLEYKITIPLTTGLGNSGDDYPTWLQDDKLFYIRDSELWIASTYFDESKYYEIQDHMNKRNIEISLDGNKILFDNGQDLFLQYIHTYKTTNLTVEIEESLNNPTFSPDGNKSLAVRLMV